ncbi:MAG TPA: hypothetical protein VE597_04490, partial [Geminicoccaceae bacterium]|nr:hypothetical protein [Geminicoccaceae bacterium]
MSDRFSQVGDPPLPEDHATSPDEADLLARIAQQRSSRRQFIKGVIASGAAISAAGYVFGGAG